MTKENAKKLLPFIKAYIEGKQIQIFYDNKWHDKDEYSFDSDPSNYRIKPESKYRPFKSIEECWEEMRKHQPFGWIKYKEKEDYCNIINIYQQSKDLRVIIGTRGYTFSELFDEFTFTDNSLFGIKEE